MLALACTTLAIVLYANLAPGLDLAPVKKHFHWVDLALDGDDQEKLYIQPSVINVRVKPSQNAAVLTQLNRDLPVEVIGRKNGWIEIVLPDNSGWRGWVHESLLAAQPATQPAAQSTPESQP
jgi:uncharacterized protein YgiM (DUF1202 family)